MRRAEFSSDSPRVGQGMLGREGGVSKIQASGGFCNAGRVGSARTHPSKRSEVKPVERRIRDLDDAAGREAAATLFEPCTTGKQVSTVNTATDPWPRRHLVTVEEYQRMGEAGVLDPEARVELIEGEIIDMPPIGTGHAYVVNELNRLLAEVVRGKAMLAVQQAVRLGSRSQPQPDLSLAKLPANRYRHSHPQPDDLLLVIEVSDSTLAYDRNVKVPLYARHGIREMWLIDLNSWQLHCMREPQGDRYASITVLTAGSVEISGLPGVAIDLSSVLVGD